MIEMMYFAQYNNQAGIIFSLDGVHNVPDPKLMYVGFFSTNPPGTFYTEEPDNNQVTVVA